MIASLGKESPMRRFWAKVNITEGCWEWTGATTKGGYGHTRDENQRQIDAHRLAWILTYGPIPDGLLICHHCDNRKCVRPDHLFLATQKDNIQDALNKGRIATGAALNHPAQEGELNNNAKVTRKQVMQVLTLYDNGHTQATIARKTGINRANVWAIVHRKSWQHL